MTHRLIIGTMSGTSADGVDAALVRVGGTGLAMTAELLCHRHQPYGPDLRKMIFDLRASGHAELANLGNLGRLITLAYADVVRAVMSAATVVTTDIAAIAAHGQTLYHAPPVTIQWFDPSLLAWETGCRVVSDFRRADCAAGGQGAPLVPFADYILLRHPTKNRVLLNLGGIANLTYLRAGESIDEVIAFDTGPANCICDWLCRTREPAGLGFDNDGALASAGNVVDEIYREVLADSYFSKLPPKSTDAPEMIRLFESAMRKYPGLSLPDLLKTACHISADAILRAITRMGVDQAEIIVGGGGTRNKTIMQLLRKNPAQFLVQPIDALGISAEAKEAVAFALLGAGIKKPQSREERKEDAKGSRNLRLPFR
jgi:anhydro-N-acetylmuramic acid kinase